MSISEHLNKTDMWHKKTLADRERGAPPNPLVTHLVSIYQLNCHETVFETCT